MSARGKARQSSFDEDEAPQGAGEEEGAPEAAVAGAKGRDESRRQKTGKEEYEGGPRLVGILTASYDSYGDCTRLVT